MAYSNYRSDWRRDRDEREQRRFSQLDQDEEESRRARESMQRDYYGDEMGGRGRGGYIGRDQEDLGPRYGREFNRGYGQSDYDQYYGDYGQGRRQGGRFSESGYGRGREYLGREGQRHWGNEAGGWEGREEEQWRNRDVHGEYDREANYGGFSSGTGNYTGYAGGSYQGGEGYGGGYQGGPGYGYGGGQGYGRGTQGGRSWGYQGAQRYGGSYQGGQGRWSQAGTQYSQSDWRDQGRYGQGGDYGYRGYESARQGYGQSDYRPGQGGYGQGGFGSSYRSGRPSGGRAYGEYSGSPSGYFGEDYSSVGQGLSQWGSQEQEYGQFRGRGPRGYKRSDDRIREEVCDRLTDDDELDASNIEVTVKDCEVTLSGSVNSREDKRGAEMLAERVSGVKEVQNSLRVQEQQRMQTGTQGTQGTSATTGTTATTGRGDKNIQH